MTTFIKEPLKMFNGGEYLMINLCVHSRNIFKLEKYLPFLLLKISKSEIFAQVQFLK